MSKTAILLMGPTASGKTDLAISLCKRFPCDVISVDSALIYRGMDIGTAKPDAETLARTPHRLIDIRDPEESYSAGEFVRDAYREMDEIFAAGRIPLLVGGTMMYFRSSDWRGSRRCRRRTRLFAQAIDAEAAGQIGLAGAARRGCTAGGSGRGRADRCRTIRQRIQRALEVHRLERNPALECVAGGSVQFGHCVTTYAL